ncbi:hypothetical protein CCR97_27505 [Rhodoplanes elegans]|uniref:Uncharacterized protein n=1 Tax=Rhodoplanes elegans TaxID=29408 RepID=A0A327K5D9_9BRAD|nr:hypothetical protein [Rhodoplanes elegans]MBK5961924.1 hypothetical protein [Rhodoplanes elegans]RAI33899.1 hypothetical protein CH338_21835 [Rhodoplanes elegans]
MSDFRSDDPRRGRPDQAGGEQPRAEPEIIPPGAPDPVRPGGARASDAEPEGFPGAVFITVDEQGRTRYTKIEPPGPFAVAIGMLVLGGIVAAILLVALGLVLFWVPVIVIAVALVLFSSYLKAAWQRLTGR